MFGLRPLIFLSLYSTLCLASAAEIRTRFSGIKVSGSSGINLSQQLPGQAQTTEILLKSPTLQGTTIIQAQVLKSVSDYNDFSISQLSESSAGVRLDWAKGDDSFSIYHQQTTSLSPFGSKIYQLSYFRSLYSAATSVGVQASHSSRMQPTLTFIDPNNGATKNRSNYFNAARTELVVEQIWSETLKAHYKFFRGVRPEDRPDHLGLEARHAFAFSDRLHLRLDLGYLDEDRRQSLKDEKGYFTVYWSEIVANYEVNYDWLLSAGFGLTIEQEYQPSQLIAHTRTQNGYDSFLLKSTYKSTKWQLGFSYLTRLGNDQSRAETIAGELTWEI